MKDFFEEMPKFKKRAVENMRRGLIRAGSRQLKNILYTDPGVPVRTGSLASSGAVVVDNRVEEVSPYIGGDPEILAEHGRQADRGEMLMSVTFGKPYSYVVLVEQRGAEGTMSGYGKAVLEEVGKSLLE